MLCTASICQNVKDLSKLHSSQKMMILISPHFFNSLTFFPSFFYNYAQVILQYNEALLTKQDRCKHFIIRQLEVSGRDVTEEGVNEMLATGKWEVFNENLLNDARITRSQLTEIEQRHKVRQSYYMTGLILSVQYFCYEKLV